MTNTLGFSPESCKTYCLMHNFTETVNQIKVDKIVCSRG